MLFNSQLFILGFLPCVLALYYLAAAHKTARQAVLVAASLAFYGGWDVRFVPLLIGLTLANWLVVRAYGRWRRDALLVAGVVMNLTVLGVCKYADFAADTVADVMGTRHLAWGIVLPLGISFFTFQKISYLVDLRRGDRHVYGLLEFAAFVTFFPQLIAGPLVRHNEIIPQFAASPRRPEMWENLARGAALFLIGLGKKSAIADTVALVCDPIYARVAAGAHPSLAEAWAASGTYMLQIYYDFSGYSDMAIGLGLMFGFRLPLNFAAPYRSASIREFWRRWHITLSRFLRDYVYIPLGGNRAGQGRQAVNVVATMLLGGLWHGAAWTFVVWGGLHGVALAANGAWDRAGWRMPRVAGWLLTTLFVLCGWVLFRSPDFTTAARMSGGMVGAGGVGRLHVDNAGVVAAAVAIALLLPTSQALALQRLQPSRWLMIPAGAALVFLLLLVGGRVPNEFIYFQF
ncbi:MBOAT family protein [Acidisphaera sp. L21]|uniref:MBOAT family O-acyltransferase n=1 Tax=Acidisphaera sp. L21 TaxID=1641851 RepID=UPI00131CCFD8|nr:MBOAT family protein [Acidisphaera sp. L21]